MRRHRQHVVQVKELNAQQAIIPQWCLLDTKSGLLSVHLDDADCFAAWTYAATINGAACSTWGVSDTSKGLPRRTQRTRSIWAAWWCRLAAAKPSRCDVPPGAAQAAAGEVLCQRDHTGLARALDRSVTARQDASSGVAAQKHGQLQALIQEELEKCNLTHSYFTLPPHLPVYLMLMGEPRSCIGHFFQKACRSAMSRTQQRRTCCRSRISPPTSRQASLTHSPIRRVPVWRGTGSL